MKYCLSNRQSKNLLIKADEIFVRHNDYRAIIDYIVEYPEAIIIFDIPGDKFEDLKEQILKYKDLTDKLVCRIDSLERAYWFNSRGIKFYYSYPVSTWYDVKGLIDLGVEYITITAPLTFCMPQLEKLNMKFRMVPNVAYDAYIPRENGIYGQWVRPEDVSYYEKGVYVFDFENCTLDQEKTLYHIYAENKNWPGNLNILITNLNINADNRGFPEELGEFRSSCGQTCMSGGRCHFCETAFKFEKTIRKYKEELD